MYYHVSLLTDIFGFVYMLIVGHALGIEFVGAQPKITIVCLFVYLTLYNVVHFKHKYIINKYLHIIYKNKILLKKGKHLSVYSLLSSISFKIATASIYSFIFALSSLAFLVSLPNSIIIGWTFFPNSVSHLLLPKIKLTISLLLLQTFSHNKHSFLKHLNSHVNSSLSAHTA